MTQLKKKDISLRTAALIAGLALLIMTILAPIANFGILEKLVVSENAIETANNIIASPDLFRTGITLFLIVAFLDITVSWALYHLFKPVNRNLSLVAAGFRIIYAAILIFALKYLLSALQLLKSSPQAATQAMDSILDFMTTWEFALFIFGFHLLVLGYLAYKSGYVPKLLGFLVILAGLGYSVDGFGRFFIPASSFALAEFTFIGEVLLIFWLLWKGIKGFDTTSTTK